MAARPVAGAARCSSRRPIHETVHLRIRGFGIPSRTTNAARIERICVREQARFLRLIPHDGEQRALDVEETLGTEWWAEEARRAELDRVIRDVGVPRWLHSLFRRLG